MSGGAATSAGTLRSRRKRAVALLCLALFLWGTVAQAIESKPLPRFTQVAPNVWVPFDLPAFSVQGQGNAAIMLNHAGVAVPVAAFPSGWAPDSGGAIMAPAPDHFRYSPKLEFVFGGGQPDASYTWTRGKGTIRANGLYHKTTSFISPAEALNSALLELPRTNNMRVYAWCNSAKTAGLHAPTQLRLRLQFAWNLPIPAWVPDGLLEAPGFEALELTKSQTAGLIFEGRMELPETRAKEVARLLGPGEYVDAPFDNRVTRLLPDRYFAALNNNLNLKRLFRFGSAKVPFTPSAPGILLGASFALEARKHGLAAAAIGFAKGVAYWEGAMLTARGLSAGASYLGWSRTAGAISWGRGVAGKVALPLFIFTTALQGADWIADTDTIENLGIIFHAYMHPEIAAAIPGPPDLQAYYD